MTRQQVNAGLRLRQQALAGLLVDRHTVLNVIANLSSIYERDAALYRHCILEIERIDAIIKEYMEWAKMPDTKEPE